MWKKGILALLVCALVLTLVAGCQPASKPATTGGEGEPASPKDLPVVTLTVLYPGDITTRMQDFLANEFGERMLEELNLKFEVTYSPWTQYETKLGLMLASGENLDWYWAGTATLANRIADKVCIPLNDLIDAYGPAIRRMIPPENLEATTVDGNIYAIPSQAMPISDKFYTLLVRTDLLEAVGMNDIASIADLDKACGLVKEKFPDVTPISGTLMRALIRELAGERDVRLTSTGYCYTVENEEGGKVYSLFHDKELMRGLCETMQDFNAKGYLPETLLTEPGNDVTRFDNGNYFCMTGAVLRASERLNSVVKNAPDAQLREFSLNRERPRYKEMPGNEIILISPASKHPERSIQFLNWIWDKPENFYFAIFGVEGKDYTWQNDEVGGVIERINFDDLWYDWMFNNKEYAVFPSNVNPDFLEDLSTWDENSKPSKMLGFTFSADSIKSEISKVETVWTAKVTPLLNGFGNFETDYDGVLKELEGAGIEAIRAETEKQLTAFLEGK